MMSYTDDQKKCLDIVAKAHIKTCKQPVLKQLFFEVTRNCNLSCVFCGSKCDTHTYKDILDIDICKKVLLDVKNKYNKKPFIVLTGGEPLLYPDLEELLAFIYENGYHWGMTSNATLLTKEKAKLLMKYNMYSISISLDGPQDIHNQIRGYDFAFDKAIEGINNLAEYDIGNLMVTSVFTKGTLKYIDDVWKIVQTLPIDAWRVSNVEPIGSASEKQDILFSREDYRFLFDYIYKKREELWPVTYGCSHFLFSDYEGYLRNWIFSCKAGITVASVMSNGDIGACLNIERRPETIFGNAYKDNFTDIWENKFELYRKGLWQLSDKCKNCEVCKYCRGDSVHSWDFDKNEAKICMREML